MSAGTFVPDAALAVAVESAVLARNGRVHGDEITYTCTSAEKHSNGDQHPSASYNTAKHVFNCPVCGAQGGLLELAKALGIDTSSPRPQPSRSARRGRAKTTGITLEEYAKLKRLDVGRLKADGVRDAIYQGFPAVWIPALLPDGTVDGAGQYRVKAKGPGHLMSAAGKKLRPFGLQHLDLARERGYVVCVEGPSCQQTLAQRGEPALGFPGAEVSREILEQLRSWLENVPRVYVVREPGAGGFTFVHRLAGVFADRINIVDLAPFKDASDMYVADPAAFADRWRTAIAAALPFEEFVREGIRSAAALLDDVVATVRRFVVMTPAQLDACALWIIHTHAFGAADATPYLQIGSAEKRSGKTRLLEVLEQLVPRAWFTGRVTAAVLVRKVHAEAPTLLLDESDAAFKSGEEYGEALRGILNSGHRRGGKVSLCVGQGAKITYQDFATFCAKAIAGIGKLPDTVSDRSIRIDLKRRTRGEAVERFRLRYVRSWMDELRTDLGRWAAANVDALRDAEPMLPVELDDRAADGWEPLLAIADRAGNGWPDRARAAARELSGADVRQDESIGVQLLRDIRRVFVLRGFPEHLASVSLIEALAADRESPWAEWGKRRVVITPRELGGLLKRFGVSSRSVRIGTQTPKGYSREQFEDAWQRYLVPPSTSDDSSDTPPQPNEEGNASDARTRNTEGNVADGESPADSMFTGVVAPWRIQPEGARAPGDRGKVVEEVF